MGCLGGYNKQEKWRIPAGILSGMSCKKEWEA